MSIHRKLDRRWALAALLLPFFVVAAQTRGQQATPSIVFVGTVEAVEAVALPSLTPTPDMCVVSVEKVLSKPEAVALAPGDKVTVLIAGTTAPQQGVHGLFFTEGWIFGETLAVRALSWEPASSSQAAVAPSNVEARVAAQMQAAADQELKASSESAELIVVGRVRRIQSPSIAALAAEQQFISEHNPDWKEAVIAVQSVVKGARGTSEVVVRFPSSPDVMWVNYPKFKEGDEGTFLLKRDSISGAPRARIAGRDVSAYMALSFEDVRSKADAARIKSLLRATPQR